MSPPTAPAPVVWLDPDHCSIESLRRVVEGDATDPGAYPHAARADSGVVVYGPDLASHIADPAARRVVQAELVHALADGPGIVVFEGAFPTEVVDRATAVFTRMLAEQKAAGVATGDHFARPGANDRLWGALDKLALADAEVFVDYYANDLVALAASAWLGPNYQINSALNIVNPGGTAQEAHRDYHLGFMPLATAARYPAHAHRLSAVLTLQGAVAHCDMPVESGPTMYLPHSQKYLAGYLAAGLPAFADYFERHRVQLPLRAGDAVFFNPALFHAAGTNTTAGVRRMANLLQISSAFGRSLEAVDRVRATLAVYPELLARRASGASPTAIANAVAAVAEGYPYPTNLDLDQPIARINPESQAELVLRALDEGWAPERLGRELRAAAARRVPWPAP